MSSLKRTKFRGKFCTVRPSTYQWTMHKPEQRLHFKNIYRIFSIPYQKNHGIKFYFSSETKFKYYLYIYIELRIYIFFLFYMSKVVDSPSSSITSLLFSPFFVYLKFIEPHPRKLNFMLWSRVETCDISIYLTSLHCR